MLIPEFYLTLGLNLAVASLLCSGLTLLVAAWLKSLPKRHGILLAGCVACLAAPAAVTLAWEFTLGQVPGLVFRDATRQPLKSEKAPSHSAEVAARLPTSETKPTLELSSAKADHHRPAPAIEVSTTAAPSLPSPTRAAHTQPNKTLLAENPNEQRTSRWGVADVVEVYPLAVWIGCLLLAAWMAGVLLRVAYSIRRIYFVRRLVDRCDDCIDADVVDAFQQVRQQLQLTLGVRLLTSPHVAAPVVVGPIWPKVIVPSEVTSLFTSNQLRSVFAHELAHVKRRDLWAVGIQELVLALFWWNPLVRRMTDQMTQLRELICDDIARLVHATPVEYARSIVAMAERSAARRPLPTLGISSSPAAELELRIKRICSAPAPTEVHLNARTTAALLLFATTLFAGMTLMQFRATASTTESPIAALEDESKELDGQILLGTFGKPTVDANRLKGIVQDARGRPAASATLHVKGHRLSEVSGTVTTNGNGEFDFVVHFPSESLGQLRFYATSADGEQLVFHRLPRQVEDDSLLALELQLENKRVAHVLVEDATGTPVPDAQVALMLGYPHTLTGFSTNSDGIGEILIPESERIEAVVAWKDDVGLDYQLYSLNRYERADLNAAPPEFPKDKPQQLVLDGVAPLQVSVHDEDGAPIKGVVLYPWLLEKEGRSDSLNLSFFTETLSTTTDADGQATIPWMPAWQQRLTTVWTQAEGYERPRSNYDPKSGDGTLAVELKRLVPVSGKVFDVNGKPAAGVVIRVIGRGRSMNSFRAVEYSAEDGSYEVLLAPYHVYLITAVREDDPKEKLVAAPQTGFVVMPNEPQENRDFHLRKPTRVHGILLNERTQDPISNERVIVYHYGTRLREIPEAELPNPNNERWVIQPIQQHYATTNDQGEFEFFLGDGSFDIRPPQQEKVEEFVIDDDTPLKIDVATKLQAEVTLLGLVVRKDDATPVADARITGVPRSFSSMDWSATTKSDGKFSVRRREEATYIRVVSPDGTLAAIDEVSDMRKTFLLQLEPVGRMTGRLLNQDQAVVGQEIQYGVDVPDVDNKTWSTRFGGTVVTDANGKFELTSLVPGWEYSLTLPPRPNGTIPQVTQATVKPGEHMDLGNIQLP